MEKPIETAQNAVRRFRSRRVIFDDKSRYLDRFGLLLLLVVLTVVLLSLIDINEPDLQLKARLGSLVTSALVAVTLMLAFRASGLAHRWQRMADIVVVFGLGVLLIVTVTTSLANKQYNPVPAPVLMVFFAALAPVVIVRRLVQHRVVTRATLLGAISAYLLIGVTFFYLFLASGEVQQIDFFGIAQPTTSFMYFSLTTVTTTGYGDLTASSNLGHLLATSEMVIGQVYLVTFVAMIVGLYASNRHSSLLNELPDRPEV